MSANISREAFEVTNLCMKNRDLSRKNDVEIAEIYISTLYQSENNVRSCARNKTLN